MSVPELTVLFGVEKAWTYLAQNMTYILGYYLREMPVERQERYRTMLMNDEGIPLFMGYPNATPSVPFFVLTVDGNRPEGETASLGHVADSNRYPVHPMPAVSDYPPMEDFYGVMYPEEDNPGPVMLGGGEQSSEQSRQFAPRRDNLFMQHEFGSVANEQEEIVGNVQQLWGDQRQRLFGTAVSDRVSMTLTIVTGNYEKTLVYGRLMKLVLRLWSNFFSKNQCQDMDISSGKILPAGDIMPVDGITGYSQDLAIDFLHFDTNIEVEASIATFMFEMQMATFNNTTQEYEVLALDFSAEGSAPPARESAIVATPVTPDEE